MRLDKDTKVCINCVTREEQDMILDIFECLGFRWENGKSPREMSWVLYNAPKYFLVEYQTIWQGRDLKHKGKLSSVVEARDFVNQWKSLKKRY